LVSARARGQPSSEDGRAQLGGVPKAAAGQASLRVCTAGGVVTVTDAAQRRGRWVRRPAPQGVAMWATQHVTGPQAGRALRGLLSEARLPGGQEMRVSCGQSSQQAGGTVHTFGACAANAPGHSPSLVAATRCGLRGCHGPGWQLKRRPRRQLPTRVACDVFIDRSDWLPDWQTDARDAHRLRCVGKFFRYIG
jgi:hypothetical protein